MTNVFVHYREQISDRLINSEMLFSRVPINGELVYIEQVGYEVVRVDHHPERNANERENSQNTIRNAPQDVEIWVTRIDSNRNPI